MATSDDRDDEAPGARPKRRPRYRGTHPRRFDERYKEREPERWPEEASRILAEGRTLAGSHRPVLVAEVLEALDPQSGDVVVDATLGAGGHALALLERVGPTGLVVGIDVDPIELSRTAERFLALGFVSPRFTALHGNMAAITRLVRDAGLDAVDAVLADLGCSSMQLDDPARGFTFKEDGPLDMRMDPQRREPASVLLARLPEAKLAALLARHADEPQAEAIARVLVAERAAAPVTRTQHLADVVCEAIAVSRPTPEDERATLARVFQALRMEVNDETGALESFLRSLPLVLAPGGRVAVISFHSGEDRRVKRAFADGLRDGTYTRTSRVVVRASPNERGANPRSSSAKLRWAMRAG